MASSYSVIHVQLMDYKLIYNPLIDYIRGHVSLCVVLLYSIIKAWFYYYGKASSRIIMLLANSGVVLCGMQAKSICTAMHLFDGIKVHVSLSYSNAGYVM